MVFAFLFLYHTPVDESVSVFECLDFRGEGGEVGEHGVFVFTVSTDKKRIAGLPHQVNCIPYYCLKASQMTIQPEQVMVHIRRADLVVHSAFLHINHRCFPNPTFVIGREFTIFVHYSLEGFRRVW